MSYSRFFILFLSTVFLSGCDLKRDQYTPLTDVPERVDPTISIQDIRAQINLLEQDYTRGDQTLKAEHATT